MIFGKMSPDMVGRQLGILPSQPPNCGNAAAILRHITRRQKIVERAATNLERLQTLARSGIGRRAAYPSAPSLSRRTRVVGYQDRFSDQQRSYRRSEKATELNALLFQNQSLR
jgi:hypothetical protein